MINERSRISGPLEVEVVYLVGGGRHWNIGWQERLLRELQLLELIQKIDQRRVGARIGHLLIAAFLTTPQSEVTVEQ
jgi:hypothetical protein